MQKYTTIIGVLKMKGDGFTYEDIQSRFGIGSSTVNRTLSTMRKLGLTYEELSKKSPDEVEQLFYPSEKARRKDVPLPDFETIYRKIIDPKNKTTLTLAWSEYKKTSPDGYQYTQFVEHYNRYVDDHCGHRNARMPVERIPGEKTYFDWAGDKPAILLDQETGELKPVSLFVSTVGFSSLCFADAFADEKLPSFIEGVADAVAFYGAVSRYFVPDNLKTAVTKHTKDELLLNVAFSDLESFYDTVVLPPPSRKPRGKATVEKAVQTCETYVLEKLRNCGCFSSLAQVNARIKEFTETLNETVMRGAKHSARELYEKFDRPNMKPLTMEKNLSASVLDEIVDPSPFLDYLLDERRKRLCLECHTKRMISNFPGGEIYFDIITGLNLTACFLAFKYRQSHIDRISIEYPCECRSNDAAHPTP